MSSKDTNQGSILQDMTSKSLLDWRVDVQHEIIDQCQLRTRSSRYFRDDILQDQTKREAQINAELNKRGFRPIFTPYTQPKLKLVAEDSAE